MTETDVLVVGAGPVGLTLACELRRRAVDCRIIDKYAQYPATSRANGVQPGAVQVLANMGAAERVLTEGHPSTGIRVMRTGREIGRLKTGEVTAQSLRGPVFANQAVVEGALRDKLTDLGGQVELHRELRGFHEHVDGISAEVVDPRSGDVERIDAGWIVGCDGGHSTVRQLLQLPFAGKDYPDHFVQADVYLEGDLAEGLTTLWLDERGLVATLPYREPGLWRIAAQVFPDADGRPPRASVELLQQLLAERTGGADIRVAEPVWLSNFATHHRIVEHYRKGRALLAGDAAHVHSPIGGQGMSTGIQDSFNLGWKLAQVINGDAPESLLDTYESERRPVALTVLDQTDVNHKLWSGSPLTKIVMNYVVFPLLRVPLIFNAVFNFILNRGSQLDVNYRKSNLSTNIGPSWKGPEAGDSAPDGELIDAAGQPTSLFAQFRRPGFTLLIFQGHRHPGDANALALLGQRIASMPAVRPLVIATGSSPVSHASMMLVDPDRRTHSVYGADAASLYLVRPDGYIGFRSRTGNEDELVAYLQRHYNLTAEQLQI